MPVQIDEIAVQGQIIPAAGSQEMQDLAHQIADRIVAMLLEEMRVEAERKRVVGADRAGYARRGGRS